MCRNFEGQRFNGLMRGVAWICILAVMPTSTVLAQVQAMPPASSSAIVDPVPTEVTLLVGRSAVIDVERPISRVSLTSADVADALVTSPNQLLVNGKAPGTISMFVWERSGSMRRFEVTVNRDMVALDRQLAQLFPNEAIQAQSSGRQIVLSGKVSRKDLAERAIDVAAGFVGKREEVISLLQVQEGPRSNQVLLKVRFAEVSRSALTELGLSIFTSPTGINNTLGRITTQQFPTAGFDELEATKVSSDFGSDVTAASGKFTFSDFLNFFILSQKYDLGLLVRALQTRGLFQSLAEPNLVAESGKEASFLAGGEFPIPVAQGSGANIGVSVQFKEFGVRLAFTPTVVGDRVHLKVRPEVSTLDFANAVTLGGFRIPALTTRRTETELELQNGQTFAIAGLMNNSMTETLSKVPGIGDIPILGYLFRSKAARKDQTELVVMITPQILDTNSTGVTSELPRIQEPYLPSLQENESLPSPPPAFEPGTAGAAVLPAQVARPVAAKSPTAAPVAKPAVKADERKAMEQVRRAEAEAAKAEAAAAKAEAERAKKEARARAEAEARARAEKEKAYEKQVEIDRRQAKADAEARQVEQQRQEKLAREAARRDAEAAKRKAEADKRAAEEAKREQEAERKRQAAVDAAAAKLKAAQDEYRAQVAQQGTR